MRPLARSAWLVGCLTGLVGGRPDLSRRSQYHPKHCAESAVWSDGSAGGVRAPAMQLHAHADSIQACAACIVC